MALFRDVDGNLYRIPREALEAYKVQDEPPDGSVLRGQEVACEPHAGARRCPANHLAVKHLHALLAPLLRRCRIEPPDDEPVRPRGLISLRPDPGVRPIFEPR